MTILLCLRSQPGWITLYTEHVQWMADYAKVEIDTQSGHFDQVSTVSGSEGLHWMLGI